jgi:hypothetical protein
MSSLATRSTTNASLPCGSWTYGIRVNVRDFLGSTSCAQILMDVPASGILIVLWAMATKRVYVSAASFEGYAALIKSM